MSLAMGRLPAILVGQIPVVTTTDREGGGGGWGTEDRERRVPNTGSKKISRNIALPR